MSKQGRVVLSLVVMGLWTMDGRAAARQEMHETASDTTLTRNCEIGVSG